MEGAAASDGVNHLAHRQDLIPTGGINAVVAAELYIMLAYCEILARSAKPLVVLVSTKRMVRINYTEWMPPRVDMLSLES